MPAAPELQITFLYFHDVPRAQEFYARVLGAQLVIDQGWSKIYQLAGAAHVGLVDQSRGAKRASVDKPVQLCLRVPDVDAWHGWARVQKVAALTEPRDSAELGIRAFVFDDPEGYQIEIQSVLEKAAA
ncbi:VOC family protein [Labrenzia sp. PHM005]|nr:VOC family protein [Labrenzia sp. PHM005]